MNFAAIDFTTTSSPRRTSVANADGVVSPIIGAGSVYLSPSFQLLNTLLVTSLSHKLLSVSQVTIELNCVVLMYTTFCILQDILTKEIIGHGTKRGVVYTTWKMLAQVMFTKYKVMWENKKSNFGIDIWGIQILIIWSIYDLIFFLIQGFLTLNVIPAL